MAAIPELMIRRGMVADGLGGEPRVADIAISDGHILAVGPVLSPVSLRGGGSRRQAAVRGKSPH